MTSRNCLLLILSLAPLAVAAGADTAPTDEHVIVEVVITDLPDGTFYFYYNRLGEYTLRRQVDGVMTEVNRRRHPHLAAEIAPLRALALALEADPTPNNPSATAMLLLRDSNNQSTRRSMTIDLAATDRPSSRFLAAAMAILAKAGPPVRP